MNLDCDGHLQSIMYAMQVSGDLISWGLKIGWKVSSTSYKLGHWRTLHTSQIRCLPHHPHNTEHYTAVLPSYPSLSCFTLQLLTFYVFRYIITRRCCETMMPPILWHKLIISVFWLIEIHLLVDWCSAAIRLMPFRPNRATFNSALAAFMKLNYKFASE